MSSFDFTLDDTQLIEVLYSFKRKLRFMNTFLSGIRILEEVNSPINGKIRVVKSLGLGTYIQVENLTQSGGVVHTLWKQTLKKIHGSLITNQRSLILGLGGGSAANLVRKLWPQTKITGLDIDTLMVEMGKKYMGLDEQGIDIVIGDSEKFVKKQVASKKKYDLILVDLYVGDKVPAKFETENYIHLVRRLLASGGVAVFNRLYYGEKRPEAVRFAKKLEKVFPKVEYFYPEANLMLLCYN